MLGTLKTNAGNMLEAHSHIDAFKFTTCSHYHKDTAKMLIISGYDV